MRFKKLFNTLSNSAALVFVAKHSHKGQLFSLISWRGYHDINKTVGPSTSMDLSTYKAKITILEARYYLVVLVSSKLFNLRDTASWVSGIAVVSSDFSSSRHSEVSTIRSSISS